MSKTLDRVQAVDLDALWDRSEPDLELSDGQLRPVRSDPPEPRRGRGINPLGVAGPVAAGLAGIAAIALSEIPRWD